MQWPASRSLQWPIEHHHRSWSSYNYKRSCQRTQCQPFYSHSAFEGNWKGEKLVKWVSHKLTEKKKNVALKCHLLLFYETTISWSDCDVQWKVDCMWQTAMTSSVAGPRSSKALPKAKLASKNGHGHCLVVCYWSDPLQLSESWQNHYIRELCSANERNTLKTATPAVNRIGPFLLHDKAQRMCPTTCHTTNTSQVKRIGLRSFASSTIFTWSLANWLLLLQTFWQLFAEKMLPQPAGGRKCFPIVCQILKHGFVTLQK